MNLFDQHGALWPWKVKCQSGNTEMAIYRSMPNLADYGEVVKYIKEKRIGKKAQGENLDGIIDINHIDFD